MSFKKRFDKLIEEDKKSRITEKDRAFLASLESMIVEAPQGEVKVKTFNYRAVLISVACALVAALTVLLILYYTFKPNTIDPTIEYFEDNFVTVASDESELNGDLILFTFEADSSRYIVEINRTFDSLSGDTLYYTLFITNATPDFTLSAIFKIVVNKNYTHDGQDYRREIIETKISGYEIKYTQDITSENVFGMTVNTVECTGEMQIGVQWVYITQYQETSLTEGTFLETLQSMIHFKEV